MNKKVLLTIFSIFLLATCCDRNQTESNDSAINESELEKELHGAVIKVWEDANNGNITELKSAHLNSPKFSKFGPRIAERQNVESTNKSETEHFLSISDARLVIKNLKIDIFENVGIATFYNNYSFIKNENSVQGKGRVTLVFLRTEAGWKIIHEHSSPFNE